MGQRLEVHILDRGDDVASVFFHWSAYTLASLEELSDIAAALAGAAPGRKGALQAVLSMLEARRSEWRWDSRGGLDPEDADAARALGLEFTEGDEGLDRNLGVMTLSPGRTAAWGMWADGEAFVDIADGTCWTDCLWDPDETGEGAGGEAPARLPFAIWEPSPLAKAKEAAAVLRSAGRPRFVTAGGRTLETVE